MVRTRNNRIIIKKEQDCKKHDSNDITRSYQKTSDSLGKKDICNLNGLRLNQIFTIKEKNVSIVNTETPEQILKKGDHKECNDQANIKTVNKQHVLDNLNTNIEAKYDNLNQENLLELEIIDEKHRIDTFLDKPDSLLITTNSIVDNNGKNYTKTNKLFPLHSLTDENCKSKQIKISIASTRLNTKPLTNNETFNTNTIMKELPLETDGVSPNALAEKSESKINKLKEADIHDLENLMINENVGYDIPINEKHLFELDKDSGIERTAMVEQEFKVHSHYITKKNGDVKNKYKKKFYTDDVISYTEDKSKANTEHETFPIHIGNALDHNAILDNLPGTNTTIRSSVSDTSATKHERKTSKKTKNNVHNELDIINSDIKCIDDSNDKTGVKKNNNTLPGEFNTPQIENKAIAISKNNNPCSDSIVLEMINKVFVNDISRDPNTIEIKEVSLVTENNSDDNILRIFDQENKNQAFINSKISENVKHMKKVQFTQDAESGISLSEQDSKNSQNFFMKFINKMLKFVKLGISFEKDKEIPKQNAKNIAEISAARNFLANDFEWQYNYIPYTCICSGDKVYFNYKPYDPLPLYNFYNEHRPNKRYIKLNIVQGYATEINVETWSDDLDLLKNVFEKLITHKECKMMKQYEQSLNHIIKNVKNYHILDNKTVNSLGRKKLLYVHKNIINTFYKKFEIDQYYSCAYTGKEIDVFISFHVEIYLSSEEIEEYERNNNYRYHFILQKNN
ncbi:hypothetical protein COBT_000585 [Conglomerata obtusa]